MPRLVHGPVLATNRGVTSRILTLFLLIVQFDLPAPLAVIGRVPPVGQPADFAAAEKDEVAEVLVGGPDVHALDAVAATGEAGDRGVVAGLEIIPLGNEGVAVVNVDGKDLGGSVDEKGVGAVDTAAGEGESGGAGLGVPQVPGL